MRNLRLLSLLVLLSVSLTSCEIIGDIFQAGMWVGIIIVVLIIGIIGWIFSKLR